MTTKKQRARKPVHQSAELMPKMKTAATKPNRSSHKVRKTVAAVALTLAALKHETSQVQNIDTIQSENAKKTEQIDRLTSIIASQTGINEDVIKGESLKGLESLPAFGSHISPEQREMLTDATVKVGKRQKGTDTWWQSCTGIKVSNGTESFVLSATHCFTDDLVSLGKGGGTDALNITNESRFEYSLLDQSSLSSKEDSSGTAIASISSVAISFSADWALMRVDSTAASKVFSEKPAIPMDMLVETVRQPAPGEEVALFSYPGHSEGAPVVATGTYLGRIENSGLSNFSYSLDLVAINPADDSDDACYYGASGSSAVFSGGSVSGPLSMRNTIGYGDSHTVTTGDVNDETARLYIESYTQLDLSAFGVICGFSAPGQYTVDSLITAINDAEAVVFSPGFDGGMK